MNGIVSINKANADGGGIFLNGTSTLSMTNAQISGNAADQNGGGVYVNDFADLTAGTGVFLTGNTAGTEGGAIYSSKYDDYLEVMDVFLDYSNINLDSSTIFRGNAANGLHQPPSNASAFSNLGFAENSMESEVEHPLSNYDINYALESRAMSYRIIYHANDETASPTTVEYIVAANGSHTVRPNTDIEINFNRDRHTFVGWNSSTNGQGTSYSENVDITGILQDITLYAQWDPVATFTVTYDANGGTGSYADTALASGSSYTVKSLGETGISHASDRFSGWNTQRDGKGTPYAPQAVFTIQENVILYAQWDSDSGGGGGSSYTVTYHPNGGQGSHRDTGLPSGLIYTVKAQAATGITYEGHQFLRWNTRIDGSGTSYDPQDTFVIRSNTTLYAQWEPGDSVPGLNKEDHVAYIIGYPDRTVRPNANITRAETTTIFFRLLTEAFRSEHWSRDNPYSDVTAENWYNNAVSTMTDAKIITGYTDGSFRGNSAITRAEFAAIASRFDSGSYTGADRFSDIGTHWAKEYINRAADKGWITGYGDGTFKPDQYITRAEAMTLINRVLERDKIRQTHPDMTRWIDNPPDQWYYTAVQEATNSHNHDRDNNGYETWKNVLPAPNWAALERRR